MSNNNDYSKAAFFRFVLSSAEYVSGSKERAIDYLKSEGLDTDAIINEGVNRIKRMQMSINASQTRQRMSNTDLIIPKAVEWVDKLLSDINFSFADFVIQEKLVLHNRNLQTFTTEEIRQTLIKYYTLQIIEKQKGDQP